MCKEIWKNFTQCSTADLISLIEEAGAKGNKSNAPKVEEPVEAPVVEPENVSTEAPAQSTGDCNCAKALAALIEDLYDADLLKRRPMTRLLLFLMEVLIKLLKDDQERD